MVEPQAARLASRHLRRQRCFFGRPLWRRRCDLGLAPELLFLPVYFHVVVVVRVERVLELLREAGTTFTVSTSMNPRRGGIHASLLIRYANDLTPTRPLPTAKPKAASKKAKELVEDGKTLFFSPSPPLPLFPLLLLLLHTDVLASDRPNFEAGTNRFKQKGFGAFAPSRSVEGGDDAKMYLVSKRSA